MSRLRLLATAVAVWIVTSFALIAQTATTGAVLGTIADPSGAVVPKADIQLVNEGTGAADRMTTNDAGQFIFASITPGRYRITVKMPGFRTASIANLTVEV